MHHYRFSTGEEEACLGSWKISATSIQYIWQASYNLQTYGLEYNDEGELDQRALGKARALTNEEMSIEIL